MAKNVGRLCDHKEYAQMLVCHNWTIRCLVGVPEDNLYAVSRKEYVQTEPGIAVKKSYVRFIACDNDSSALAPWPKSSSLLALPQRPVPKQ